MRNIFHPYNYSRKAAVTDTSSWESICEPFDGFTLTELVERQKRGLLTDAAVRKPIYHDVDHTSPDMEKVMRSDHFEREVHARATYERVEELKKKRAARKGKASDRPTTSDNSEEKKEPEKKEAPKQ